MGYSYSGDDTPLMCFNGPKTYQLKWFETHHKTLTYPNYNWLGTIYHSLDADNLALTDVMIVKIPGFSEGTRSEDYLDYYVSFNKYSGQNIGTKEARDKVAIHSSQTETYVWAPKSKLLAELGVGQQFEFTALGIDVIVEVTAIDTTSNTPSATLTITSGTEAPSQSFVPTMTISPSQEPSISPSVMPSPVNGISQSPTTEYYTLFCNFLSGDFWAASKGGIMFDITATEDIMISRLDIDLFWVNDYSGDNFSTDVEIYTKSGTYVGFEQLIGSWTKHMDTTTVQPPYFDDPSTLGLTPLNSDVLSPIIVPGGTTLSIFITNRDAKNFIEMAYSSSTATDYTSDDGVVTIKTGIFQKYAEFSGEENDGFWWVPVAFSGIVYYDKTADWPSHSPSLFLSGSPSISHAPSVSQMPSLNPSGMPSLTPSQSPTFSSAPSLVPSKSPSQNPTVSSAPSLIPSTSPSQNPTVSSAPSLKPSTSPSQNPTVSSAPSLMPSRIPSSNPSAVPTTRPTRQPTATPSITHSKAPSGKLVYYLKILD